MKNNSKLSLILTFSLFIGCSSLDKSREIAQSKKEKKSQEDVLAEVSSKLKEMVESAKKGGQSKVDYLAGDMFLKANAATMENDFKTANLIYENLVNLVDDDDFIHKKYAISLIRTGELKKSLSLLDRVFKNSKNQDSQTGLLLAGVHSSLGEVAKSQVVYRSILAASPKNEEACVFLGKSYALEDKFAKAVATLKNCEKRIKGKGIFSYYIGKLYVDKEKLDIAKTYFKKSAKIQPSFSQSVMALGVIYEEQKKSDRALKVYKKYLKNYPNDPLILNRIVQIMFSEEKFKEVIPYAEKLSDFEPDNLNLKVKLGILYTDAKEYAQAISTFKSLLVHVPKNDKILYYLGAIYQEKQELESAIDYFTMIPPESGLYQDSSVQVAQMLSSLAQTDKTEKSDKAFIEFVDQKIAEQSPLKVEFSVIKASYLEATNAFSRSIASLEEVSTLENFSENHKYYLASLYEKVKKFEESEKVIKKILKDDPENAHAWNFLGYSLLERKTKMDDAFKYISKAVELRPEDGFIRDSLGWYYFKVGKIDEALNELLKAIKVEPKDVSIQKHLAIVYSVKRDFKSAKRHIDKAISYASQDADKAELDEVLRSIVQKRLPASAK